MNTGQQIWTRLKAKLERAPHRDFGDWEMYRPDKYTHLYDDGFRVLYVGYSDRTDEYCVVYGSGQTQIYNELALQVRTAGDAEPSPAPADVYVVLKNADITEGRGPMVFHKVFATFDLADDYVMSQPGIYGSEQRRPSDPQRLTSGDDDYSYNGYDIVRTQIRYELDPFEGINTESLVRNLEELIRDGSDINQTLRVFEEVRLRAGV